MKVARLLVVVCALAAACAEAGGDTKGGELTEAGAQAVVPGDFIPPVVDSGPPPECGEGTKWSELYRDIFGPTGKPGSCSLQSNCHGTADAEGANSGAGIHCFDEKTCRESMIEKGLVKTVTTVPDKAILFSIIRNRLPDGRIRGIMPKQPSDYIFPQACLVRMRDWIARGAPAD